jgi:hypothetical protein
MKIETKLKKNKARIERCHLGDALSHLQKYADASQSVAILTALHHLLKIVSDRLF